MADENGYGKKTKHEYDRQTETPDVSDIQNPDVTHETNDVNVGTIFKFVAWLSVGTAIAFLAVFGVFKILQWAQTEQAGERSPLARKADERRPPEPYLQLAPYSRTHPLDDMRNLKAYWREQTDNYGILDQGTGTVRIPVAEAKRLMLERNMFPVRGNNSSSAAGNRTANGQASGLQQPSIPAEEQPPTFQSSGRQGDRRLQ